MKKWKTLSVSVIAVALLGMAGCSSSSSSSDESKARNPKISIQADVVTLDPSLVTDQYSNTVIGNVQEGLTRVDSEGKAQMGLAESVEVSEDGLVHTFKIKEGLKWSNGADITAEDFVYSWQRAVNPETASEYAYLLSCIENADAINSGEEKDLSKLGVVAKGDDTLVVTLNQPTPYFEFLTTQAVYLPEEQEFVEEQGKQFGTSADKMLYSGPYKFAEENAWNGSNKEFTVVKNEDYHDADSVKAEGIDFQVISDGAAAAELFKQGKLDLAYLNTTDLVKAHESDDAYTTLKQARTDYIEYNQTGSVPALQNEKIREALNLATNREAIVSVAAPGSTPATTLSPKGLSKTSSGEDFAEYAAQGYSYDAEAAKKLWEEGLKELGQDKLTLKLKAASDLPISKATAEYLQESWETNLPGLTLELELVPFKQRIEDAKNQNFELVLSGWGGDYAEPTTFLSLFVTDNSYNNGKFSSKEYDDNYKKAASVPDVLDPEALDEDYKAIESAMFEGSYINPIDFQATPVLLNPKLKNFEFQSTGLNFDFKLVYLEE
ncbi:MAG: peptide ABC transporter substrate-binding protein [Lactovum sp.]